MPNHKSSKKRVLQTEKKNLINRMNRSRVRTAIKSLRSTFTAKDAAGSKDLLPKTVSIIDKMVNKGIMKKNTAARHKSRLTRHVSELVG